MQDSVMQEIALEYLKANRTAPTRTIARMMYSENKEAFKDLESARRVLRYYRGSAGAKDKRGLTAETYVPRLGIPETELKTLEPFVIGYDSFPLIVGGDAHFPYHDEDAVDIFFNRATDMNAKTIVLLGDWMDMYQASTFIKDPRARRIPEEIKMMAEFLEGVRMAFPGVRIIYKIGNHEDRLENYLKVKAPELYGLKDFELELLLKMKDANIECIPSRQMLKFGRLYGLHGHELAKGFTAPVNPARGLYLKTKKSAICAHYHQTSEHVEKNLDDKIESCWTIGCLCGLKPDYAPVNKWNHGFAEIYAEDDMYTVKNRKIINYRVL